MVLPVTTIPSRQLSVWRRLYTRYSLEPEPASVSPDVSKTIQPITNADELLQRPRGLVESVTVTGTGGFGIALVPAGVRWHLVSIHIRQSTGTFTFDRVILRDTSVNLDIIIDQFASATFRTVPGQSAPPVLDEGDRVSSNVDTHSVNGLLLAHLWLIEEDLF